MKKLLSKFFALALVMSLVASIFVGCANGDGNNSGQTKPPVEVPTQQEINQKATDAVVGAGMGMLIGGTNTSATADIQVTDTQNNESVLSLTSGVLNIKGSPNAAIEDVEVFFGSAINTPLTGGADLTIILDDGTLYLKSGEIMVKAASSGINAVFASIISIITGADAKDAIQSATVGGIDFMKYLGDSTYSETENKVQIVLSVKLESFAQGLAGKELKISVDLKKGQPYSFEKISIDQTIDTSKIIANVNFSTTQFEDIAAPKDADKYTDVSVYMPELLPEVVKAVYKTFKKQSFELKAHALINNLSWSNSDILDADTKDILLEMQLDASIQKTQDDVKALINYNVGGLAAMFLSEKNQVYIPAGGNSLVYVAETKSSKVVKTAMTSTDYFSNLSPMSDLLPVMGELIGLNFDYNANFNEMLSVVKTVKKSINDKEISFKLELDMLKLFPNNVNTNGVSKFTEQNIVIGIGADGLIKSITANISSKAINDDGTAIGGDITFDAQLVKTDNVVVNEPDGFNKNDYTVLYSQFKSIKINDKNMISSVKDDKIELDILQSESTITINPLLVNDSNAILTINDMPVTKDFVYQLTGEESRFTIKIESVNELFVAKTVTVVVRRSLYRVTLKVLDENRNHIEGVYPYILDNDDKYFIATEVKKDGIYFVDLPLNLPSENCFFISDYFSLGENTKFSPTDPIVEIIAPAPIVSLLQLKAS